MKGILSCPECKHQQKTVIPTNKCLPFYHCKGCKKLISAKIKCCVFCDYGDKPCPVAEKSCC